MLAGKHVNSLSRFAMALVTSVPEMGVEPTVFSRSEMVPPPSTGAQRWLRQSEIGQYIYNPQSASGYCRFGFQWV